MDRSDTAAGYIPSVEDLARAQLRRMPTRLQRLISTAFAGLSWVGLPTTVVSTLGQMRWVFDALLWLYERAVMAQPLLRAAGEGLHAALELWRGLTYPVWQALFGLLPFALPTWAPDLGTLVVLLAIGAARNIFEIRQALNESLVRLIRASNEPGADLRRIPHAFPFEAEYASQGLKWTPLKRRDARRLWPRFRKYLHVSKYEVDSLNIRPYSPPKFPIPSLRQEYGWYLIGCWRGRAIAWRYLACVAVLTLAYVLEILTL